jgi:hypothetical protein
VLRDALLGKSPFVSSLSVNLTIDEMLEAVFHLIATK